MLHSLQPKPVRPFTVGEIFRTDTVPGVFHVQRKEDDKLKAIRFELEHSTRILHVFGPTKSGKTHFARVALGNRRPFLLSCIEASTPDDVWKLLAADLRIPIGLQVEQSEGAERKGKAGLDVPGVFSIKGGLGSHSSTAVTQEIAISISRECAKKISEQESALIIDDFQWLSPEHQSQLIRQLRPFLDRGIRVVLISVYDRTDRDDAVGNAEGRIKPLPFPRWTPRDIEQIAIGGFALLNCRLEAAVVQAMRRLSSRNPLLMTEICLEICKRKNVTHTNPKMEFLSVTAGDLEAAITSIAQSQSWLLTRFLETGEERPYQLRCANRRVNLRTLLLLALKGQDPNMGIGLDALRGRMQRLLAKGYAPPARSVLQGQITRYIRESQSAPKSSWFLDYSVSKKLIDFQVVEVTQVHIVNPYFRTVVEWYLAPMAGLRKSIDLEIPAAAMLAAPVS
jgi:hypothetical protein